MNIFEGARRALWVSFAVAFLLTFGVATQDIYSQWDGLAWVSPAKFAKTDHVNWNRLPVGADCPTAFSNHSIQRRTPDGRLARVVLCYGENSTASERVDASQRFQLPQLVGQDLDRAAVASRWEQIGEEYFEQGKWLLAWLFGSTIVSYAIGWIARGLLGIPRGMDVKPIASPEG